MAWGILSSCRRRRQISDQTFKCGAVPVSAPRGVEVTSDEVSQDGNGGGSWSAFRRRLKRRLCGIDRGRAASSDDGGFPKVRQPMTLIGTRDIPALGKRFENVVRVFRPYTREKRQYARKVDITIWVPLPNRNEHDNRVGRFPIAFATGDIAVRMSRRFGASEPATASFDADLSDRRAGAPPSASR
jgi:hypothetical protein